MGLAVPGFRRRLCVHVRSFGWHLAPITPRQADAPAIPALDAAHCERRGLGPAQSAAKKTRLVLPGLMPDGRIRVVAALLHARELQLVDSRLLTVGVCVPFLRRMVGIDEPPSRRVHVGLLR
jgi:hypothetical protein